MWKRDPVPSVAVCLGGVITLNIGAPLSPRKLLVSALSSGLLRFPLRDLPLRCPQDDSTGEILFDEVFHALSRCLGGLLRPFRVPGSCIDFQPEIYVTIQAYSSIIGLQSHQVLHPCSALASSDLVAKSPLTKSLSDLYSPCPKSPAILEPDPWSSP